MLVVVEADAKHLGSGLFVVEADALSVIQAVLGPRDDQSRVGMLIDDSRFSIKELSFASICFVPREANKVAHGLAGFTVSLANTSSWVWDAPGLIQDMLIEEF
ncbi:hypothetical protein CerSpe_101150 [Prunus speciosa]